VENDSPHGAGRQAAGRGLYLRYLPDFWLPELALWFEVKGTEPTDKETCLVALLSERMKKDAIIAVGAPKCDHEQLMVFPGTERRQHPNPWPYISDSWRGHPIKFLFTGICGKGDQTVFGVANRYLGLCIGFGLARTESWRTSVERAYEAASCARFEYGETPVIKPDGNAEVKTILERLRRALKTNECLDTQTLLAFVETAQTAMNDTAVSDDDLEAVFMLTKQLVERSGDLAQYRRG
jgi:hypothetical protein